MSGHLITTATYRTACPECGAPVLAAIVDGCSTAVDIAALDLTEEVLALVAGRGSYDLVNFAGRVELVWRDQWRIARRTHPVLADHPHAGARRAVKDPARRRQPQKPLRDLRNAQLAIPSHPADDNPPF